jgi:hypothetical protein
VARAHVRANEACKAWGEDAPLSAARLRGRGGRGVGQAELVALRACVCGVSI